MFKRFESSQCSTSTPVKASVQRKIISQLVESNPMLEDCIDEIIPKKPPLTAYKVTAFLTLYCLNNEPVLFEEVSDCDAQTLFFFSSSE